MHKLLIFTDRLFRPLYVLLNALKWTKQQNKNYNNFVVIKFFGIGSITRIAHVMDNIGVEKEQVTFITLKKNKVIIEMLKLKAIYITAQNPMTLAKNITQVIAYVWKSRHVSIIDMERASNISGIFRLLLSIGKPCHSFFFEKKNKINKSQHFVTLLNKPATVAIAEIFNRTYNDSFQSDQKPLATSNEIFVNVNAGEYLPERKFPLEKYAALIKLLAEAKTSWHFFLTGAPSEYDYVSQFEQQLIQKGVSSAKITIIAGKYNLPNFMKRLENAKLLITNDSGPLHLAYTHRIPTVAIWGPTSSYHVGYKDSRIMLNLNATTHCTPCFSHPKSKVAEPCNKDITCFKLRDIEEMAAQTLRFVNTENSNAYN